MEINDRAAMAALLATARKILQGRIRAELSGDAKLDAAMIASAMGLAARALEQPGTAWSARPVATAGAAAARARARALRPHVRARLAVTNPDYVAQVDDAPP
jgi:hypothetical protein